MLLTEFDEKKYREASTRTDMRRSPGKAKFPVFSKGEASGFTKGEASGFTKGEASGLRKGQAQGREDALRDLARKKPPRARTWQPSPLNWRLMWKPSRVFWKKRLEYNMRGYDSATAGAYRPISRETSRSRLSVA